ncbi:MAG TPA: NAD(P)-binding domain-containing protein [Solirubrobacterales bacterium]|nr:NAD(P)-binding domain-containing protein [Solirubrobacterales bacterium]
MQPERRHLIVGAGYSGNGVAKAFKDAGIPYDQVERNSEVGGNWLDGVYDSTHIISSRDSTGYADFPMPDSYPDFPSRTQMLDYLKGYVDHFGLRDAIEFETEVVGVSPLDPRGLDGWRVELASGEVRHYAGVVVANGHHWDKRHPSYPGEFAGKTIHSKDYRRPADLEGERVLVVGVGNSGCDIAVEAAKELGHATISMRRGNWFLPKTLLGIPLSEWDRPGFPVWAQRIVLRALLWVAMGPNSRYGLPKPDYRLFDKHPIVNSQLLYQLRHGIVDARPDIERLDGRTVHFVDGTSQEFDTIVWATGFDVSFPFLDPGLFPWEDGRPVRVAGMMPPGLANLYAFGVFQPRGGAGPLITAGAEILTEMARLQGHMTEPLADLLGRVRKPSSRMLVGVNETMREIKRGRRALRLIAWWCRRRGTWVERPQPAAVTA